MTSVSRFFCGVGLLVSSLCVGYDDIHSLRKIENYLGDNPSETILLLDIDDTLGAVPSNFGGERWFRGALEAMLRNTKFSVEVCLRKLLPVYFAAQMKSDMATLEDGVAEFIENLKPKFSAVFCLSTRGTYLADNTIRHLAGMGMHFDAPDGGKDEVELDTPIACTTKSGIVFSGDCKKEVAFKAFLDKFGLRPKRIIFVNDKAKYLAVIGSVCDDLGIEFVGLRFAGADAQKKDFDFEDGAQQARKFIEDLGWTCHMGFAE